MLRVLNEQNPTILTYMQKLDVLPLQSSAAFPPVDCSIMKKIKLTKRSGRDCPFEETCQRVKIVNVKCFEDDLEM